MSKSIRDYLLDGIQKQSGVIELENRLTQAREGMYVCGVKAAIVAGDRESFLTAAEKLMDDFRANRRKIAEKHGMEQAKDTHGNLKEDGEGNPVYTVPSSLSTVKSVLSKAFEAGIDFGTLEEPESFGAIRTALKVAREAEQAATGDSDATEGSEESPTTIATADAPEALTGDEKRRNDARVLLAEVASSLDGYSGKALTAILKLIRALAKVTPDTVEVAPKAAKKSAAKKKAA